MNKDNKYYTPSIEEFHVGFECEILNTDKWELKIITSCFIQTIDKIFRNPSMGVWPGIRVKYLDKEDIESLGFKFTGKAVDDWFELEKKVRLSSGHWFNKFRLQHDRDNSFKTEIKDHNYNIKIYGIGVDLEDVLFEGVIKNKSELKCLLKQLGIYEK